MQATAERARTASRLRALVPAGGVFLVAAAVYERVPARVEPPHVYLLCRAPGSLTVIFSAIALAFVIVGLGCEGVYASHLVEAQNLVALGAAPSSGEPSRPRVLNIQEEGGIARTVEAAAPSRTASHSSPAVHRSRSASPVLRRASTW